MRVPKIKLSRRKDREKLDLSFDCSTTANLGQIQPTMCREMVPNSTFKVKVDSLVRLAPLPVPTFGRMKMCHRHVFVSLADMYEPFNAMLAGQQYAVGNNIFYPKRVPTMNLAAMCQYILFNYAYWSVYKKDTSTGQWNLLGSTTLDEEVGTVDLAGLQEAWDVIRSQMAQDQYTLTFGMSGAFTKVPFRSEGSMSGDGYGTLVTNGYYVAAPNTENTLSVRTGLNRTGNVVPMFKGLDDALEQAVNPVGAASEQLMIIPTPMSSDIVFDFTDTTSTEIVRPDYRICVKLNPIGKRLRTILVGLGYQFTPFDMQASKVNPYKLFAFYKAYFELFNPKRDESFNSTACYRLLKLANAQTSDVSLSLSSASNNNWVSDPSEHDESEAQTLFIDFIIELANVSYYLENDYFSIAVIKPNIQNGSLSGDSNTNVTLFTHTGSYVRSDNTSALNNNSYVMMRGSNVSNGYPIVQGVSGSGGTDPVILKLAQKLLRFASRNTIIGRSIRDYLRVNYGVVDFDTDQTGGVTLIGDSDLNIQISDIMNQTSGQTNSYLGEYAGKGIGYGDSNTFEYTAQSFGYWITLTYIKPISGYYQGIMKENLHSSRFDFYNENFDAAGYQVLERRELKADYNFSSLVAANKFNPGGASLSSDLAPQNAFGFVPRYSEYKVGRNIVNGDFSIPSMENSMKGYVLDRKFKSYEVQSYPTTVFGDYSYDFAAPSFIPSIVTANFRRLDIGDEAGDYNRIFYFNHPIADHFLIHNIFSVDVYAPMKSLATSFDTIDPEDDTSVDIAHS